MEYPKEWDELPKNKRRKLIKKLKRENAYRTTKTKSIIKWLAGVLVLVVLGGATYYWWTIREVLPPTDFAGHVEQSPESHILDKPMPIQIQKHMLEHSDGDGPPGVIINYNCEDFNCEENLIENLTQIAQEYPKLVYLAPFSGMSKKIAITRYQQIETFDSLEKDELVNFIERK
jgi:hypothetical protein